MYGWPKTIDQQRQRQSPSPTSGLGQAQVSSRRPADFGSNQSYYWMQRYNGDSEPAIPEPDHDEAFVEESGIKVVQTLTADDEHNTEEEEEDSEQSEEEEDPLHELDMWDDTIVEEGEDDDDDDARPKCQDSSKSNGDINISEKKKTIDESSSSSKSEPAIKSPSSDNDMKQENVSSTSSESSMSGSSSVNASNLGSANSMGEGCADSSDKISTNISKSSQVIPVPLVSYSQGSVTVPLAQVPKVVTLPASNAKTATGFWLGKSNKPRQSATGVPQTQPYTGYQIVPATGKGKGGRMVLPLARINAPKHTFIIKKVLEPDSPIKRSTVGERRAQEQSSGQPRNSRTLPSPVWLRRSAEAPTPKSNQAGDLIVPDGFRKTSDENRNGETDAAKQIAGEQPDVSSTTFRQRAGTWSIANSRRAKNRQESEEEAKWDLGRHTSGNDLYTDVGRKDGKLYRPRSKSDAKNSLSSRQRRKSGDDVLNVSSKEKKKEATPGFLESFRPRSKSDASRNKKPNLMTTMKHAVQNWNGEKDRRRRDREAQRNERKLNLGRFSKSCQQTLVSPSANNKKGRRSGDTTPVGQPQNDVYHTWHAGAGTKTAMEKVWDLFRYHKENPEDRQRRKSGGKYEKGMCKNYLVNYGQLHRRHSMEPDRRRNASGSLPYIRGEDPTQSAHLFRDCRGLPKSAPFLENVTRRELEENETQIIVKFFKYHVAYDLIPTSAKLVVFDTKLPVKKAFFALVHNGVRAAPLWDTCRQDYIGMLTITDFIRILQQFYRSKRPMNDLESYDIEEWRRMLNDEDRMLVRIEPDQSLYEAIKMLINHKIHRLPVIDPTTGNVLYIITHKRILKFLYLYINELPKPSVMQKTLKELGIGTYHCIQTATKRTKLIDALDIFVSHRVSALPIIDEDGKLIDIYAKFDAINLAAKGTYDNLDVTLEEANEYRNEWFEGVLKCTLNETIAIIMERIVRAEVHRLVIVDENDVVMGIVSLSDILKELVLKPGEAVAEELQQINLSAMMNDLTPEKIQSSHSSDGSEGSVLSEAIDDTKE